MAEVKVDVSAIVELQEELDELRFVALGRLGERGMKHLRDEVPKVTKNLWQGIREPDIDKKNMTAEIVVSARSARRGPRNATLHLKSGKKKQITLRPQKAFNYAETVVKGRPAINPRSAKALLIPVQSVPSGQSYITEGDRIYLVRKSAAAVKPNPFDERAAKKLQAEAVRIVEAAAADILK